jgi:hypothetical protein
MRAFYLGRRNIFRTASGKSDGLLEPSKFRTPSGKSLGLDELAAVAQRFPLPWSHYVRLLSVRNPMAQEFYETEALRGGWTLRQLERQFYERTALSRNKVAMLRSGAKRRPEDDKAVEVPLYPQSLHRCGPDRQSIAHRSARGASCLSSRVTSKPGPNPFSRSIVS